MVFPLLVLLIIFTYHHYIRFVCSEEVQKKKNDLTVGQETWFSHLHLSADYRAKDKKVLFATTLFYRYPYCYLLDGCIIRH